MSTEKSESNVISSVSSAKDFLKKRQAREQGELLTLSSGLVVRLKRPDATRLVSLGILPASLFQRFMKLDASKKDLTEQDIKDVTEFQNTIVKHSMIEPKVVDEPNYDNNEISLDDLEEADIQDIWVYVNGGLEAVEKFRKERQSRLDSGLDGKEVSESAS